MKDYAGRFVRPKYITFVLLFVAAFVVVWSGVRLAIIICERGEYTVHARVYVTDGVTEDELFASDETVKESVTADKFIRNKYNYTITQLTPAGGNPFKVNNCLASEVYNPVKCSDEAGKQYWVTLTSIDLSTRERH